MSDVRVIRTAHEFPLAPLVNPACFWIGFLTEKFDCNESVQNRVHRLEYLSGSPLPDLFNNGVLRSDNLLSLRCCHGGLRHL